MHVCICILACISVHDLKVDITRQGILHLRLPFTVRKILTSLLANTVRVFTAVYRIERSIVHFKRLGSRHIHKEIEIS